MDEPTAGGHQQDEILGLQAPEPGQVIETAFRRAARLADIDWGLVLLADDHGSLEPRWHWGVDPDDREALLGDEPASVVERCVRTGRTQVVSAGAEDPGWPPEWRRVLTVEEGIVVPLYVDGSPRGAFVVGWLKPFQADDRAVAVAEGVAYQVAAVLQHAQRLQGVEENRRYLDRLVEAFPLPVAVLDGEPLMVARANAEGRSVFGDVAGQEVAQVVADRRFRSLGGRDLEPEQVVLALGLLDWREEFRIRMRDVEGRERILAVTVIPEAVDGSTLVVFRDSTSEFGFEEKRTRFVGTVTERLEGPLGELRALGELLLSRFRGGREPLAQETTEALAESLGRIDHHGRLLKEVAGLQPIHGSELRSEVAADLVRAAWEAVGGHRTDVRVSGDRHSRALCAPRHVVRGLEKVLGELRERGVRWLDIEVLRNPATLEVRGRGLPFHASPTEEPSSDLVLGAARAWVEATGGDLALDQDGGSFSLTLAAPIQRKH